MDLKKRIDEIKQNKLELEHKINSAIECFESKTKIRVTDIGVEFVVKLEDVDKVLANEQEGEKYKKMGLDFEEFETKQKRKK